jgi:hypothetical protein
VADVGVARPAGGDRWRETGPLSCLLDDAMNLGGIQQALING